MNYNQFSRKTDIKESILIKLGVLNKEFRIIQIDNNPDYDISDYKREIVSDYYFHNSWDFRTIYNSVVKVEIMDSNIFHYDNIIELSNELSIYYDREQADYSNFLLKVLMKDEDAYNTYSFGIEVNDFILHNLRISSIDNLNQCIYYDGSFQGDTSDIDPLDWGVYTTIKVTSVPDEIDFLPFYKSLIAESYLLLVEKKYKLSYFLTYSALESFINYQLGEPDEQERLKDKLKELFNYKFNDLSRHQIYTSIIDLYDTYTRNRNTIAHGRNQIEITETKAKELLLFVLILISTYELNVQSFEELINKLTE